MFDFLKIKFLSKLSIKKFINSIKGNNTMQLKRMKKNILLELLNRMMNMIKSVFVFFQQIKLPL